ncbi:phospholipase A and acyltransferase 4-like isoform 2-T2 [Polymixia lowei]
MAPTLFDKKPQPGDLIEISRGPYQHWAVYIGGNEVIHMIPPSDDFGLLSSLASMFQNDMAEVRCEKIQDVVGPDSFQVNNMLDDKYRPRERRLIVRDARRMVGQVLPYCVANHNCEHFVTELRYGKAQSQQVRAATEVAVVGAVATVATAALGAILFGALLKDDGKKRRHDN